MFARKCVRPDVFWTGSFSTFSQSTHPFLFPFLGLDQVWCSLGQCTGSCDTARYYFEESKGECRNKMARQPGLESLCAESKDIPGLRLLHLELCHSPAPPPPYILAAAFAPLPQTLLVGKPRVIGNSRPNILICLPLKRMNSAKIT